MQPQRTETALGRSAEIRPVHRSAVGKAWALFVFIALTAAACGGSVHSSAAKTTVTGTAGPAHPNLTGKSLIIDIGSPTPVLSRATTYVATQILRSWGAHVSLENIGACSKGGELVITGRAQVTLCPASVALNSGLVAFGSDMPRANYLLVAKSSLDSLASLSGHRVGLNNPTGTEATLLPAIVTKYHITGLSTVVLGTQPVLLGALASGRIDAGFVLPEQWLALQKKAPSLHLLAAAATLLPDFAETYLLAKRPWLQSHQATAIAIDEAWLKSREQFNGDETSWVSAALEYTTGRYTTKIAQATWSQEHALGIWPNSNFGFSASLLKYNGQLAYSTHLAKRLLSPSQWTDPTIWTAASASVFPGGG